MSDKLDLKTPDMVNLNIERIAALFPHCVTETIVDGKDGARPVSTKKIDFDLLRQELSRDIVEGPKERYRLEWPGKREAIVTANMPTTNTLRPVREDSVNFDTTENLYIEGDNLEVLKLFQESYLGKVKMIYIDPPYNTGNDFVYKDNFAQDSDEYKADSGMTDELGNRLVANPETAGRYHSDWLTMMYPRLKLARNLLTDDGVIFISIDDNEVHNLRKLCDEVFGEDNNAGTIIWQKSKKGDSKLIAKTHEYIAVYLKDKESTLENGIWRRKKEGVDEVLAYYNKLRLLHGENHSSISEVMSDWFRKLKDNDPRKSHQHYRCSDNRGLYFPDNFAGPDDGRESRPRYDILHPITGKVCKKPSTGWRWDEKKTIEALNQTPQLIHFGVDETTIPCRKSYLANTANEPFGSIFYQDGRTGTLQLEKLIGKGIFQFPKYTDVIVSIMELVCNQDSIILDFFSGSATTAHAVMQLNAEDGGNRKFIMVQLPEKTDEKSEACKAGYKNICEIGKERIRRAGEKLKAPSNSPEGGGQATLFDGTADAGSAQLLPSGEVGRGLDVGFRVYRLDSSNMQDVYYRPQDYQQAMMTDLFANHIKDDRTADDLVAQVMLDWGLPLSLPITQTTIAGKTVYKVDGNALYCCFDEGIDEAFVRALVETGRAPSNDETPHATSLPLRIVFHDYAFANDTAKENVRQLLKQLSGDTEMRVV